MSSVKTLSGYFPAKKRHRDDIAEEKKKPKIETASLAVASNFFLPLWCTDLERVRDALDNILMFTLARGEPCIFERAKRAIEQSCRKQVDIVHLGRIQLICPSLYKIKSLSSAEGISIEIIDHETCDSLVSLSMSQLQARRTYFRQQLVNYVAHYHNNFLTSIGFIQPKEKTLKRWHVDFDVEALVSAPSLDTVKSHLSFEEDKREVSIHEMLSVNQNKISESFKSAVEKALNETQSSEKLNNPMLENKVVCEEMKNENLTSTTPVVAPVEEKVGSVVKNSTTQIPGHLLDIVKKRNDLKMKEYMYEKTAMEQMERTIEQCKAEASEKTGQPLVRSLTVALTTSSLNSFMKSSNDGSSLLSSSKSLSTMTMMSEATLKMRKKLVQQHQLSRVCDAMHTAMNHEKKTAMLLPEMARRLSMSQLCALTTDEAVECIKMLCDVLPEWFEIVKLNGSLEAIKMNRHLEAKLLKERLKALKLQ